jgi:uncharacterized RDD family membrane protein YckC
MTSLEHSIDQSGVEHEYDPYQNVPLKRFLAWCLDVVLISLATAAIVAFTLLTALLFLPAVYACISFLYRWATLASASATPGMILVGIEIRGLDGTRLDGTTALLHTAGYFASVLTFPLQMISIGMMLLTARRQGLTDVVLRTVAVNRRKPGTT